MKFSTMSARDRRALLLGAIIAVPGVLIPLVVKPYLHALSSVREETAEQRDLLVREQHAVATLPTLPAARAGATQRLTTEVARLFQGSDELIATGNLAQYVAAAAQDAGVRLEQSETRPPHAVVPGVQALQVEIRAEGDLDGVAHFLRKLETGGKLIRVGTVSIDGGHELLNLDRRGLFPGAGFGAGGGGFGGRFGGRRFAGGGFGNGGFADGGFANGNAGNGNFANGNFGGANGGRRRRRFLGANQGEPVGSQGSGNGAAGMTAAGMASVTPGAGANAPAGNGGNNGNNGGSVEVLSLSASIYGYRLTTAPWTSVEPRVDGAPSPFSRTGPDLESLDAVVDHDPFNTTRARPSMSYAAFLRASQDTTPRPQMMQRPPAQIPPWFRLVGTVTGGAGAGLGVFQVGDASLTVRVGERIPGLPDRGMPLLGGLIGYTLSSLRPDGATLTSPDGVQLTLPVTQPGSPQ